MLKKGILVCSFFSTSLGFENPAVHNTQPGIFSSDIFSSYVASLSVGPVWEDAGKTQTFYLAPEIEKTYTAREQSTALAEGELFIGLYRQFCESLQGQLGLAVAYTGNARLAGHIWDDLSYLS